MNLKPYLFLMLILFTFSVSKADEIEFAQTVFIKSSKEKVWNALINPALVKKYFLCPLKEIGENKGDAIIYGKGKEDFITGKIISLKPNQEFIHTFKFLPPGHEGTEKDEFTKVGYYIEEQEGIVQLTLVHNGFKEKNQSFYNITSGWPYILSNLKTFLETGKALHE